MITAAIAALPWLCETEEGLVAQARVGAAGALLALAFFCKQTGIFYVALGGAIVLVLDRRRLPAYVGVAGAVGLGGTGLLYLATDGWFWTYISKIHRAHDFNMDRFWKSFGNILWHFPLLTIVVAIAAALVLATRLVAREVPRETRTFLIWLATFAVSTIVGAIGWGTEFAHFNSYMPAFLHGGLAAGAAIPAIAACVDSLWRVRARPGYLPFGELAATLAATLAAGALFITLGRATWDPHRFIPSEADHAAGDRLIARIAAIDGEVWMPSHPWYLALAGKQPHVHRMGVKDVSAREPRPIAGLDDSIATHRFAALVFDNHDLQTEYQVELQLVRAEIHKNYREAFVLPANERPRVYTGAQVVPASIWLPVRPAITAPGSHAVFDFEQPTWEGWTRSGPAWGDGPEPEALSGQDPVIGATGARFATSMHGGDAATGRMTSPSFAIDGARMTMKLGGGTDATKLRVELWVEGAIARTTSVPEPGGETLRTVTWNVEELRGKRGTLVLVDDGTRAGAHFDIDDVVMWDKP
jgi:hypothetical protein